MKVAIFDPNKEHRELLKEAIELQQAQVFEAKTGSELLSLVKTQPQISRVILDPRIGPFMICKEIYESLKQYPTISIVVYTTANIKELWKAGFPKEILYVQKPYCPFNLINIEESLN